MEIIRMSDLSIDDIEMVKSISCAFITMMIMKNRDYCRKRPSCFFGSGKDFGAEQEGIVFWP